MKCKYIGRCLVSESIKNSSGAFPCESGYCDAKPLMDILYEISEPVHGSSTFEAGLYTDMRKKVENILHINDRNV